jgi:hypothetical protein
MPRFSFMGFECGLNTFFNNTWPTYMNLAVSEQFRQEGFGDIFAPLFRSFPFGSVLCEWALFSPQVALIISSP